jgi:hypothetical protein
LRFTVGQNCRCRVCSTQPTLTIRGLMKMRLPRARSAAWKVRCSQSSPPSGASPMQREYPIASRR